MCVQDHVLSANDNEELDYDTSVYLVGSSEHPMVAQFRRDFPHVFNDSGKKITRTQLVSHSIDTGKASPIRLSPRRYSLPQQAALKEFMESGLHSGTIKPSNSPWSSLALVVPKPDGRYRPCVDFRALNIVIKKNAFPFPNIEDQIQHAAGHEFYTTFDLRDGFWQIPMARDSIEKTAFSTPDGHYEFYVMPFGLTNAPATFQSVIDRILQSVCAYTAGLLDVCIWGDMEQELAPELRSC